MLRLSALLHPYGSRCLRPGPTSVLLCDGAQACKPRSHTGKEHWRKKHTTENKLQTSRSGFDVLMTPSKWASTLDFLNVANWTLLDCLWCIKLGDTAIQAVQNRHSPGTTRAAAVDRICVILFGGALQDPYPGRVLGARAGYQVLDKVATAAVVSDLQRLIAATSAPLLGPPPAIPIDVHAGNGASMNAQIQAVTIQVNADISPMKAVLTRGFADVGVQAAAAPAVPVAPLIIHPVQADVPVDPGGPDDEPLFGGPVPAGPPDVAVAPVDPVGDIPVVPLSGGPDDELLFGGSVDFTGLVDQ